MKPLIAVCIDSDSFKANRIFDASWARNFPGALAIAHLGEIARASDFDVATGDIALSQVRSGRLKAEEVSVVQDMDTPEGLELVRLGARGCVLSAMESPLFAWPFYDRLAEIGPLFENRVLFEGAFKMFSAAGGNNNRAMFPAYSRKGSFYCEPWSDRKDMVMVAANKFFGESLKIPLSLKPSKYRKWIRKRMGRLRSKTLRACRENELQSRRFSAIEYFGAKGRLNLFGRGWEKTGKLPDRWRNRLGKILKDVGPAPCDDKVLTTSRYRFALCFENVSFEGYVTEKIFDCIAAGAVPVYLGAPDIEKFVPGDAFINTAEFPSWAELEERLDSLSEAEAVKIIRSGQNFLLSESASLHTFEGFARWLFGMVE